MSVKQRAEPLAPEARRQSIIQALIPLLLEKGGNVTTAQIAEAAGIAEGTIFRVFPDKSSLISEALKSSFDPAPELDQLARIERELPFEVKLRKTAAIVLKRSERVHALVSVLRSMPPQEHSTLHAAHRNAIEANSLLFWGITRIFQDHSGELAVEPARAAAAFRGLLFAVSFPLNDPDELISADEAIEVLLRGVMKETT
jgi:AcrR family transcriptional regulator